MAHTCVLALARWRQEALQLKACLSRPGLKRSKNELRDVFKKREKRRRKRRGIQREREGRADRERGPTKPTLLHGPDNAWVEQQPRTPRSRLLSHWRHSQVFWNSSWKIRGLMLQRSGLWFSCSPLGGHRDLAPSPPVLHSVKGRRGTAKILSSELEPVTSHFLPQLVLFWQKITLLRIDLAN